MGVLFVLIRVLKLGVEQNHALVHNFEVAGHLSEVTSELPKQVVHFLCLDFDDVTLRPVNMLGRNDQVVRSGQKYLNQEEPTTKVVLTHVKRLLLDDALSLHFTRVAPLFVKWLARGARLASLLLNDEVGGTHLVDTSQGTSGSFAPCKLLLQVLGLELVGVLADVL